MRQMRLSGFLGLGRIRKARRIDCGATAIFVRASLLPAPDLQFVEVALDRATVGTRAVDLEVDEEDAGIPAEIKSRGRGGVGEGMRFRVVQFHPVMSDDVSYT